MIKHLIHDNICKILQDLNLSQQREFTVEIPNLADHGDYSTNVAMILAKENKTSPKVLAEKLIKELKKNKFYKKVELAGPGFLNFHLSKYCITICCGRSTRQGRVLEILISARKRKYCWSLSAPIQLDLEYSQCQGSCFW